MIIGYGILLNDEVFNYTRSIELKLANEFGTIGGLQQDPHITIKRPFEISSLKSFEEYFDELVQTITSFEITLNGIGMFPSNSIFIKVVKNSNLTNLNRRILNDLKSRFQIGPHPFDGENMVFHTTIGMTDISDTFEKQLDFLKNEKPKFTFNFNKLGMFMYLGEKEGWIIVRKGTIK